MKAEVVLKQGIHIVNYSEHWYESDLEHLFDIFVYLNDEIEVFTSDLYEDVTLKIDTSEYFENPGDKTFSQLFCDYMYQNFENQNENFKLMKSVNRPTTESIESLKYNSLYDIVRYPNSSKTLILCGSFFNEKLSSYKSNCDNILKTVFGTNYYNIALTRLLNHIKAFLYFPNGTTNWFYIYDKSTDKQKSLESEKTIEKQIETKRTYLNLKEVVVLQIY